MIIGSAGYQRTDGQRTKGLCVLKLLIDYISFEKLFGLLQYVCNMIEHGRVHHSMPVEVRG